MNDEKKLTDDDKLGLAINILPNMNQDSRLPDLFFRLIDELFPVSSSEAVSVAQAARQQESSQ